MRASTLWVSNYKCFQNVRVELHRMNCVIGENSSGKTALLESIELTLGQRRRKSLSKSSFHDLQKPVVISVEFVELNAREAELFMEFVQDSRLLLTWKWDVDHELRVFTKSQQPEDELLRPWTLTGKQSKSLRKHQAYKRIYGSRLADYLTIDPNTDSISRPDWENAAHQFIKANAKKIRWVDFECEVPNQLLASLPAFYQVPPFYDFSQILKTDDVLDPMSRGISQALKEANDTLGENLKSTISDFVKKHPVQGYDELENIAKVVADFQAIEIEPRIFIREKFEPPTINLTLEVNDGIRSDLQQKGHGLRRLVLYAQLITTIQRQERDRLLAEKPPRNYIIGVEELELYLHPLYQSIMLGQLAQLVGTGQYQVVFTSHSPNMVDVFDLESVIRMSRAGSYSQTFQISYSAIANKVNALIGDSNANADSVRERVGEVLDVYNCQSLFSRKVVLVEGNTERYALPQLFSAIGYRFEREGVSVIPVGGKGNIDKFIFLMQEFGIPHFTIFDFDRARAVKDKASHSLSERLAKLLQVPNEISGVYIGKKVCVFEDDFENTFSQLYGDWAKLDTEAKQIIGAKQESGKSLRARYISKQIAKLLAKNDPSIVALRNFLVSLSAAIAQCDI